MEPAASIDGGQTAAGRLQQIFPTSDNPGVVFAQECMLASPLVHQGDDGSEIIVAVGANVVALQPRSGRELWRVELPAPQHELAFVVATPAVVGDMLVVSYHTTARTDGPRDVMTPRLRHLVAVLDLKKREVSPASAPVELSGETQSVDGGSVVFLPENALGRSALVIGRLPGDELGKAYVTFGNGRDIQPWHGFAFELDLDQWKKGKSPVSGFMVTTPESDCGREGVSGSRERLCGGGLWAPSGPLLAPTSAGYELFLAAGNGQFDLARRDYANSVLRVGPGLQYSDGCDASACARVSNNEPVQSCVSTCSNLFVPRMPEGEVFPEPAGGVCDGLDLFACWGKLDYLGGSTPAIVTTSLGDALIYPAKDGAVYLVDRNHLGTMYDRLQLVDNCGTDSSPCKADWAGMIVTKPAIVGTGERAVALVPTFMFDDAHSAGVVAVRVQRDGSTLSLRRAWEYPSFSSEESKRLFRRHPSRIAIEAREEGDERAWLVEVTNEGAGQLIGLQLLTGALVEKTALVGRGMRFIEPLVVGKTLYTSSCSTDSGPSFLESFDLPD